MVIYALIDPRDGAVRYVGKTEHPHRRFSRHRWNRDNLTHTGNWIRSLLREGFEPRMDVLEVVAGYADASEREKFWIAHYRGAGAHLTNLTDGGDGMPGYRHSLEARKRIATSRKGKTFSDEHKARLRESRRRVLSDESYLAAVARRAAKLTDDDVKDIHERLRRGETQDAIAREFGTVQSTISAIKNGARFRHVKKER